MSFRQYVCCNFKGITGETCEQRFELVGGVKTLPVGWVGLVGSRRPSLDDVFAHGGESAQMFSAFREQVQAMGGDGVKMIQDVTANMLEVAPRVEVEAHLCPRHAETMPLVEWHLVPNVD